MRHRVDGKQFGRNTSHRKAMFRNLANSVIQKEQIVTTLIKAKEAKRVVDRLITLGKTGTPQGRRLVFDRTRDKVVVSRLFGPLAERYKKRAGGYTRVVKISDRRRGDGAEMAVLELVDHPPIQRKRIKKDEDQKDAAGTNEADPMKGFKKMFGKKKDRGATSGKGPGAAPVAAKKQTTRRKTGE